MNKRIAISIGDINGIGPEVIIKSLQKHPLENITPIILGTSNVLEYYCDNLSISLPFNKIDDISRVHEDGINVLTIFDDPDIEPGKLSEEAGKWAMHAVEKGIALCQSGQADALVTAPISKKAVNLAGYHIPGHTEFLADKTSTTDFMMMLVHESLRVGLVTGHIPISEVSSTLSQSSIEKYIEVMHKSLLSDFGLPNPRIAVLGLNPHAGDSGVIGTQEQDIIIPAIKQMQIEGLNVSGPYPADGFFGNKKNEQFDGILAMYHDQGLIPFKTLSFGGGVNFTAGLPIIRTSPDHGTAFDIAGQGKANPSSFTEAFNLASKLIENRKSKFSQ